MNKIVRLIQRFPLLVASFFLCVIGYLSDFARDNDGLSLENMLPVLSQDTEIIHDKVRVVKAYDGDTLKVQDSQGRGFKVRLYGIDAPEKGQPFANVSREFMKNEAVGKEYTIEVRYKDKYKRYVVVLYDNNGVPLQEQIVANGLAWVYPRFCDDVLLCVAWDKAEQEAKDANLGLWQEKNPQSPWDFKHNK